MNDGLISYKIVFGESIGKSEVRRLYRRKVRGKADRRNRGIPWRLEDYNAILLV
jgi:hypothetical protein